MNMPRFTAEASLYKTSHSRTDKQAIDSSPHMMGTIYLAAPGQDFPNQKCTCKGCGSGGGDVTGQCATVCKDKDVFSKGSEPYDYCKASAVRPTRFHWYVPGGNVGVFRGLL